MDPFCCTSQWDNICVAQCNSICGGCGIQNICGDGECKSGENCASCPQDCGECPKPCGLVTAVGCCIGSALFKCTGGVLEVTSCAGIGTGECGWNLETKQYTCGTAGLDPSGVYPIQCQTDPPDEVITEPQGPYCQGVPFAGCCNGQILHWCDWSGLHTMDCSDHPKPFNTCGWNPTLGYYDCGGTGADPSGTVNPFCPNISETQPHSSGNCTVGIKVGSDCASVTTRGCCDDGSLFYCQNGAALCRVDCSSQSPPLNSCGWNSTSNDGYYDCGGSDSDPSDTYQKQCSGLPPGAQKPDVIDYPDCPGIPTGGCCDGSVLTWCEQGLTRTFDCSKLANDDTYSDFVFCGSNPTSGKADCIKKKDPSPPVCEFQKPIDEYVVEPEPEDIKSDTSSDIKSDLIEIAQDMNNPEAGGETSSDSAQPEPEPDGSGVIIIDDDPIDTSEPDAPKKGGCSTGSAQSPVTLPFALSATILLVTLLKRRSRPRG